MKSNRKPDDLVAQFEEEYDSAFVQAQKAAETTATDGWQAVYVSFMEHNQASRAYAAKGISDLTDVLGQKPINSDDRKELKKQVTLAVEACEAAEAFDLSTVAPIRKTVEQLGRIIADYENKAASAARQTPLLDAHIEGRMAEAIAMKPRAQWNPRVGVVTLVGQKVA